MEALTYQKNVTERTCMMTENIEKDLEIMKNIMDKTAAYMDYL